MYGFPVDGSGATTASSNLTLPSGFYAFSIAIGPTGKTYIGGEFEDAPAEIMVFAAGAIGSAKPLAVYTGQTPGTFDYPDFMTVNQAGELFVMSDDESVEVFAANANSGDLPTQYLTTLQTNDEFSYGIGADKEGNIYLTDDEHQAIDVFAAGATGNATPARVITSTSTSVFTELYGVTADGKGNVFVVNYNYNDDPFDYSPRTQARPRHLRHDLTPQFGRLKGSTSPRTRAQATRPNSLPAASTGIFVFAVGATGTPVPLQTISGVKTTVNEPEYMVVDALDNIYYADYEGGAYTLMVFPAGTNGNEGPKNSMTSASLLGNDGPSEIAVY
jgi:hypothetical protein